MSMFNRNAWFRKGLRGDGWATPEYFGAKGGVGTNDKPAFDAALTALASSGGKLLLGPRSYRIDGGLSIPSNVSLTGVPDVTAIAWNHATANGLVFTDYNEGPPTVVEGIRFINLVPNTGNWVTNNVDARVQLRRCSWNGFDSGGAPSNNLQGKILVQTSSASDTHFIDCDLKLAANIRGVDASDGVVRIERGSMFMPQTYSEAMVYAGGDSDVTMEGVAVDLEAHTSGTAKVLQHPGGLNNRARMRRCRFKSQVGSSTTAFWWEEGAQVVSVDNDWGNMGSFFTPYATNNAGVGSIVDLLPMLAVNAGSAAAVNNASAFGLRAYESVLVMNEPGGAATIALLAGIFPGQVLRFAYHAVDSHSVSFVGGMSAVSAPAIPGAGTLTAGQVLTGTFVWERRDVVGSYRWVMQGDWGVCTTLV